MLLDEVIIILVSDQRVILFLIFRAVHESMGYEIHSMHTPKNVHDRQEGLVLSFDRLRVLDHQKTN